MSDPIEILSVEEDVLVLSFDKRLLAQIGDIEDLDFPEEGDEISQGDEIVTIFGSDDDLVIHAPISGLILEVNEAFPQEVAKGKTWLFKIEANEPEDLFKFEED
ncbi:MAG: hypothetical protein A3B70_06620 [Deltaproteobacteria bacterium RIFCSPHIGHO2_02_FULL_40_11]|nr:MAG: hypothetical protein A3B70_06620 [Deltaproteobacteria bacterium RIFCSPHIGHO2_02_FULL_40_11]